MIFVSIRGAPATVLAVGFAVLSVLAASPAVAQRATAGSSIRLSLDDALRIAQAQSPTVDIARAGVTRATGQRYQARSQYMPQLSGTAGYTKTLESQFSNLSSASPAADTVVVPTTQSLCTPFIPPSATPDQRAAALAQAASCQAASGGGGFDLSKTSFGATNQYAFGLNFSQNVFAGGRIRAQNRAADAQLRSANIEVSAQRAQLSLDVTQAYYDAALADQLVTIADSALAQTQAVLDQTRLSYQVGNSAEYDLLRAQVTHDNQLPVRIQAEASRQVAYLQLKQLLNMPLDDSLQLTTGIEAPDGPALPGLVGALPTDTTTADRAPVREGDEAVNVQEAQVKIAHAERIPAFSIVSSYERLYFPAQLVPNLGAGTNNWTVGLSTNFPLLDGGRIKGDQLIAQSGLDQARAQAAQTRQFAALDTRVALNSLTEAQAAWDASRGTADQAQRAYAIDQVRFREGISTQTDLSQSRLLLEQAVANRAQAARDLAVARVRLALLRDLPLQSGSNTTTSVSTAQQQQQQQQQQQTQPTTTTTTPTPTTGVTGTPGSSGTTGSIQP